MDHNTKTAQVVNEMNFLGGKINELEEFIRTLHENTMTSTSKSSSSSSTGGEPSFAAVWNTLPQYLHEYGLRLSKLHQDLASLLIVTAPPPTECVRMDIDIGSVGRQPAKYG